MLDMSEVPTAVRVPFTVSGRAVGTVAVAHLAALTAWPVFALDTHRALVFALDTHRALGIRYSLWTPTAR